MPCKRYELGSLSVETAYRIANLVCDCGISCHVDDDKVAIELEAEQSVIDRLDYSMRKIIEVAQASVLPHVDGKESCATTSVDIGAREWGAFDELAKRNGATRTFLNRGMLTILAPSSKIPGLLSLASAFDFGCNVESKLRQKRLLAHIERGHTNRQALLGRMNVKADEFDELIEKLVASGLVVKVKENRSTHYRKAGE